MGIYVATSILPEVRKDSGEKRLTGVSMDYHERRNRELDEYAGCYVGALEDKDMTLLTQMWALALTQRDLWDLLWELQRDWHRSLKFWRDFGKE